jgi:hypothetical protein
MLKKTSDNEFFWFLNEAVAGPYSVTAKSLYSRKWTWTVQYRAQPLKCVKLKITWKMSSFWNLSCTKLNRKEIKWIFLNCKGNLWLLFSSLLFPQLSSKITLKVAVLWGLRTMFESVLKQYFKTHKLSDAVLFLQCPFFLRNGLVCTLQDRVQPD